MTPFWMVAKAPQHEHSKTAPTRRFDSLDAATFAATFAATGLARETGAAFVVLGVVAVIRPDTANQPTLL